MGIVLIGMGRSNQILKYLLILKNQVKFLPHTWANSAPLVDILSLRIRFLFEAIACSCMMMNMYVPNWQPSRKIFCICFMTFSAILYIIIHYNYTYFTYEYLLDVGKYFLPSTL